MRRITTALVVALLSGLPAVAAACVTLCVSTPHHDGLVAAAAPALESAPVPHHGHHGEASTSSDTSAQTPEADQPAVVGTFDVAGYAVLASAADCPCCATAGGPAVGAFVAARVAVAVADGPAAVHPAGVTSSVSLRTWASSSGPPGPLPDASATAGRSPILRI